MAAAQSKQDATKQDAKFCKFCADALKNGVPGVTEAMVTSHYVRETIGGKPCCPTLAATTCPYCKETGHTRSHCERLRTKEKRAEERKQRFDNQQQQRRRHFATFDDFAAAAQKQMNNTAGGGGFVRVGRPNRRMCRGGVRSTAVRHPGYNAYDALCDSPKTPPSLPKVAPKAVKPVSLAGAWGDTAKLHEKIAERVETDNTAKAIAAVDAHIKRENVEVAKAAADVKAVLDINIERDFGEDDNDSEDEGWGNC